MMDKRRVMSNDDPIVEGSYKGLTVWQKRLLLVKHIYRITKVFPSDEKYGIVSQM